tara:strand:+ start:152 stop:1183 length:1032 start_codon:yes stop_codon:yes gene_type:complete
MSFESYKFNGLTGLANLGNTCFLNSTLQCLSHTYELNDFLKKETFKKKLNNIPDTLVLLEWDKLREMIWSENCVISPGGFIQIIQKIANIKNRDIFTGYAQNDLPEFLLFLIDCFHNALHRKVTMNINGNIQNKKDELAKKCYNMIKTMYTNDYSEFLDIFYGIHVSNIYSVDGEILTQTPEPYFLISLPIPQNNKNPTLEDCFDLYTKEELLTDENQFIYKDSKIDALREIKFWKFPDILVIDLKRFNNNAKKNKILITFPLENFNVSQYCIGYNKDLYVYDLYGICNHSGGVMGGHYTSYIKNANGKWYHFNDTHVTEIDNLDSLISNKAYCFFYRKKIIK